MSDHEARIQYIDEKTDDLVASVGRIEGFLKALPCQAHAARLTTLDVAIRGNGRAGINTRLDRIEQRGLIKDRVLWALVGTFITGIGAIVVSMCV